MAINLPILAPINLPFCSSCACNSGGIKIYHMQQVAASYGCYADRKEVVQLHRFVFIASCEVSSSIRKNNFYTKRKFIS